MTITLATWDSPPRPGTFGYEEFKIAFDEFLRARDVHVKKKSASEIQKIEDRGGRRRWEPSLLGIPENGVYDIGQDPSSKLMPFQVSVKRKEARSAEYINLIIYATSRLKVSTGCVETGSVISIVFLRTKWDW